MNSPGEDSASQEATTDLAVVVRDRRSGRRRSLSVQLRPADTVADVAKRLSVLAALSSSSTLQLLFCGRPLDSSARVADLLLGPTTCLLALVLDGTEAASDISVNKQSCPSKRPSPSSFFVFCTECSGVRSAKLRVYCDGCSSSAVLVKREPAGWKDVLTSHRISIECTECFRPDACARFSFKCSDCGEIQAALRHLRRPPSAEFSSSVCPSPLCCICFDDLSSSSLLSASSTTAASIVDLGCHHLICLECFSTLIVKYLQSGHFRLLPPHGFTITCPYPGCPAVVRDAHHFRLLGDRQYKVYKMLAAEAFVREAEGGMRCPAVKCGASFIWTDQGEDEEEPEESVSSAVSSHPLIPLKRVPPAVRCPHCAASFCRDCRSLLKEQREREEVRCVCEADGASAVTIEATTRRCPKCSSPTERSGGCAHMRCSVCSAEWCFVCVGDWTEECQWNHWFS